MFGTAAQAPPPTPDYAVPSPPSDSVTSLNFTPAANANFLLSTAWSGQVQLWDTALQVSAANQPSQMAAQPKLQTSHQYVLDAAWYHDGSRVVTVGGDRQARIWDLASNQQTALGTHDAPISKVCVLDATHAGGVIATGGWDTKLKYWDPRQGRAVGEVKLDAKVYAMDARERLLVVGTSEEPAPASAAGAAARPANERVRKIACIDVTKPMQPFKVEASPLAWQTRSIAAFFGNGGYLVGSIEGRVGVQNFEGMHPDKQLPYTFKCHRKALDQNCQVVSQPTAKTGSYNRSQVYDEVHAVNVIRFHPAGTFMTAGSDGVYTFWDKDEKARLVKPPAAERMPIVAAGFNSAGSMMAYACCYDWSQGHANHDPSNPQTAPQVWLHKMEEREFQRRPKAKR